jgi:hypothetical protein
MKFVPLKGDLLIKTQNTQKQNFILYLRDLNNNSDFNSNVKEYFKLLTKICLQETGYFSAGSQLITLMNMKKYSELREEFFNVDKVAHKHLHSFATESNDAKHFVSSQNEENFNVINLQLHQMYSIKLKNYASDVFQLLTSLITQSDSLFEYPGFKERSIALTDYTAKKRAQMTDLESKNSDLSEICPKFHDWENRFAVFKLEASLLAHVGYTKSLYEILANLPGDNTKIKKEEDQLKQDLAGLLNHMSPKKIEEMIDHLTRKVIPALQDNIEERYKVTPEAEVPVAPSSAATSTSAAIITRLSSEEEKNPIQQSTSGILPTASAPVTSTTPAPAAATTTPTTQVTTPSSSNFNASPKSSSH